MRRYLYIMVLLCAITQAQAEQRLTLAQCREMAVESNLNLRSSGEKIAVSEDMLAAYKTNHLLNLSASANYLYTSASFTRTIAGGYLPTFVPDATTGELKPNIVGTTPDGEYIFGEYAYMPDTPINVEFGSIYGGSAMLTQPIYMGGKINNAIRLARVGVKAAQINHSLTKAEVIVGVDEAFYTTIKVGEMLLAAQKYRAVVEEFHRQVSSAQRAGMATRNDVMKVEVRLSEAKLMCQKAENGVRLAKMNLCYAIGLPLSTRDIEPIDEFEGNAQMLTKELEVSSRPEYKLLQEQIEAKSLEAKITRSEFLPSVVAIGSVGYANGIEINNKALLNTTTWSAGVMVNVPIFHWGEGRRKSSAARSEVEIARNQFEDLSKRMTLELMQAINSYEEATMEVELGEVAVAQAEENMRLSEGGYHAGMETIADYLEAQALWQKAQSELVEAKAMQRIAYSKWQKARGLI